MIVYTKIKFQFDFITTEEEIQDIIANGDYYPSNIVSMEVKFHE